MLVAVSAQATETLTLDPQHTYILWHIKHFGFSTQAGKWYASGTLMIDKDRPQNSKVNVTVQVTNIVTGNAELDKHLKGKLFFDVEHFPTATFVSDQVKLIGKKAAKVHGILTLHGVSKPVVLDVKLNETGINPITEKMTAGFSAKTRIKRSDFNITTLLPSVSDEVNIDIEAEAYKPTN
jgi:polyisoprenoid-binding protein YceI